LQSAVVIPGTIWHLCLNLSLQMSKWFLFRRRPLTSQTLRISAFRGG